MPCCKCEEHKWPDPQDQIVYTDAAKKDYCLFHAPAENKGMSVEVFNAKVFARINKFKAKPKTDGKDALCNLSGTIFPGYISFLMAYGKDNPLPGISFFQATFSGKVRFGEDTFGGMAYFAEATFSGEADFWRTTFSGMAHFESATFSDKAELQFVQAKENALRLHSLNSASLANLNFSSMETECFSFKGCDWPDGGLWPETQNKPDYKSCEELYRSLKQKAAGEHDQPMVSKWHYREKLMGMRQKWYRRFVPITPTWLYWASSGFGERSVRAWWLLVGLCLVPFALFGHERILETVRSGNPDWKIIGAIFDEWSLCLPFIQTGFKGTAEFLALEPWKLRVAWIFQILIALQASLFAFALRNRFRR